MFLSLHLPGYWGLYRLGPEVVIDSLQETTRHEVGGLLQKDGDSGKSGLVLRFWLSFQKAEGMEVFLDGYFLHWRVLAHSWVLLNLDSPVTGKRTNTKSPGKKNRRLIWIQNWLPWEMGNQLQFLFSGWDCRTRSALWSHLKATRSCSCPYLGLVLICLLHGIFVFMLGEGENRLNPSSCWNMDIQLPPSPPGKAVTRVTVAQSIITFAAVLLREAIGTWQPPHCLREYPD